MTKSQLINRADNLDQISNHLTTSNLTRIGFAYPTLVVGLNIDDLDLSEVISAVKSIIAAKSSSLREEANSLPDDPVEEPQSQGDNSGVTPE